MIVFEVCNSDSWLYCACVRTGAQDPLSANSVHEWREPETGIVTLSSLGIWIAGRLDGSTTC